MPPIIDAVLRRDLDGLRSKLAAGAEVDEIDRDGRTALHHAAIGGEFGVVRTLLNAGARREVADANGWRPLHHAASGHHVDVASALLEAGALIDPEDSHGNTPLFRAVFESRGRGEMIRLLLAHGADASHSNRHGVSPLGLAETIANYDVKKWFEPED